MAKVSKIMQAQNTGAPALNAALAKDNTTLSGLGKLMSTLTLFQSAAQSFSSKAAASSPVSLDATTLTKKVTDLIGQYNTLTDSLNGLRQGELKSDATVSRIQSQLARVFLVGTSGTATSYLTMGSIGISTQKNGVLTLDATKFQNAVKRNPEGVAKLFTNGGKGIADNLVNQIQGMVGSAGSIPKETTAINKDISALNVKKDSLTKALTAQANALVKMYSQQNSSASQSGSSSLFNNFP